ncbi:nicotinamidase [Breznakiella homolactica]|uniref:nicotinamidase n=1 Tax=Breznakiella homolactica TaxID=2798577 RepID=A0A7T7XJG6_9SPIR|nr:nicotinamidase [Breznakiella homolactica]QQO07420.1 nicotinamidase [Breznakiella homolactica]
MVIDFFRSALLEIDVQNDFCPAYTNAGGVRFPEGTLAVKDGGAVVAPLNRFAEKLNYAGGKVVATQDWHPLGHVSFASSHPGMKIHDVITVPIDISGDSGKKTEASLTGIPLPSAVEQVLWPDHCVQGSAGAQLHGGLNLNFVNCIIRKGSSKEIDSYSAFFENDRRTSTGLEGYLRDLDIGTVFLGGLATDYCVFYSAMDAVRLGFVTVVLTDAVRGVGSPEGSVEKAFDVMRSAGISFMDSKEIR